jgi:hypothetical protein
MFDCLALAIFGFEDRQLQERIVLLLLLPVTGQFGRHLL